MSDLVVVTQPYVPAYRVPLFDAVASQLKSRGLELQVFSASPTGEQSLRGDRATGPWHHELRSRTIHVAGRQISVRSLPPEASDAVVLVSELEALNTLAWRESFRKRPLILWGHGKGYVNDTGALADRVEWVLARRSAHIMTYAASGRDYLVERGGIRGEKVTAIGNSTDTSTLRHATEELLGAPASSSPQPHALYVGGLDASKRIDFLLDAFVHARAVDPTFTLTVVGRGADQDKIRSFAAANDTVRFIEEARGRKLAEVASTARAMWIPGRVGLVAVDALALGLPVHTTRFAYHAPEIEYLQDDEVGFFGPSAEEFAQQSLRAMANSGPRRLRSDIPTIDRVARAFASVIFDTLDRQD